MRRLLLAALVAPWLITSAYAEDAEGGDESSGVASAQLGPGKVEAGIYLGGFISNTFHQFYDPALVEVDGVTRPPQLERVNPQFGGRFAFFPSRFFGIELDASTILASTKMTGEGAQI